MSSCTVEQFPITQFYEEFTCSSITFHYKWYFKPVFFLVKLTKCRGKMSVYICGAQRAMEKHGGSRIRLCDCLCLWRFSANLSKERQEVQLPSAEIPRHALWLLFMSWIRLDGIVDSSKYQSIFNQSIELHTLSNIHVIWLPELEIIHLRMLKLDCGTTSVFIHMTENYIEIHWIEDKALIFIV